jgi:hypothetical protein
VFEGLSIFASSIETSSINFNYVNFPLTLTETHFGLIFTSSCEVSRYFGTFNSKVFISGSSHSANLNAYFPSLHYLMSPSFFIMLEGSGFSLYLSGFYLLSFSNLSLAKSAYISLLTYLV